jgi:hypothetical protein
MIENAMDDYRLDKRSTNIVRWIILATTILSEICLCMRHFYKVKWLNNYFLQDNNNSIYFHYNQSIAGDNIFEHKRVISRGFFFEFLILLICPIPHFDFYVEM